MTYFRCCKTKNKKKIDNVNKKFQMSQEPQGKMDFDSDFGNDQNKMLRRPWVAFFHFFFRVSALTVYLFGTLFSGSFMGIFVSVILLLSLDFWTVKNVSGRIMVSLQCVQTSFVLKGWLKIRIFWKYFCQKIRQIEGSFAPLS